MKVSLDGLISQAGSALRCSRDSHGPSFALVLEALHADIKDVVSGAKSLEAFAEFWCVKRSASAGGRETP